MSKYLWLILVTDDPSNDKLVANIIGLRVQNKIKGEKRFFLVLNSI